MLNIHKCAVHSAFVMILLHTNESPCSTKQSIVNVIRIETAKKKSNSMDHNLIKKQDTTSIIILFIGIKGTSPINYASTACVNILKPIYTYSLNGMPFVRFANEIKCVL